MIIELSYYKFATKMEDYILFSDYIYVTKWLLLLFFLQISLQLLLTRSMKEMAMPLSFTASLLISGIISYYLALFQVNLEIVLIIFLLFLITGLFISKPRISIFKKNSEFYVIFVLFFISMLSLRIVNPDILTYEKLMDFMILHSMCRFPQIPPVDLWYGGSPFNVYYYYGYWLFASLGNVAKIPPQILFNLILPTIFGLLAVNIFAIGKLFLSKYTYIPLLSLFIPNVLATFFLISGNFSLNSFFSTILLIPGTDNEYTIASFLIGDCHPHVIAFILQSFLILIFAFFIKTWNNNSKLQKLILLIILSITIGVIFPINAWNLFIYIPFWGIVGLILIKQQLNLRIDNGEIFYNVVSKKSHKLSINEIYQTLKKTFTIPIIIFFGTPLLGLCIYLPYYLESNSQNLSLGIVSTPSPIIQFFLVWGFFYIALIWILRKNIKMFPYLFLMLIPAYLLGVLPLVLTVILGYFIIMRRENFQDILTLLALSAIAFCEIFYLNDHLIESQYRYNTVFKMYSTAWLLLGISITITIGQFFETIKTRVDISHVIYFLTIVCVCIALVISPYLGYRTFGASTEPGLRGDEYLDTIYPADFQAIKFLRNLTGSFLIVEPADYYNDNSLQGRISTFSGIPTVIGEYQHESLWREQQEGSGSINQRVMSVQLIYEHPEIALYIMDMYGANLLYVGPEERKVYNVTLPVTGLDLLYNLSGVSIYKRNLSIPSIFPSDSVYRTNVKINLPDFDKWNQEISKSYKNYSI